MKGEKRKRKHAATKRENYACQLINYRKKQRRRTKEGKKEMEAEEVEIGLIRENVSSNNL